MYKIIEKCRICGGKLKPVINLGDQVLTGVFPRRNEEVESGPIVLAKCMDECGLVQMRYSYEPDKMYGDNYGYRSGLNKSMVAHLNEIVQKIEKMNILKRGDLIIDIGSNDGTLLSLYDQREYDFLGIDPSGAKFKKYYADDVELFEGFFGVEGVRKIRREKKARVITSIAMFYDLEDPISFVKDINSCLCDDGIWLFEQSYYPLMVKTNSYDTICHEHLEFYSLKQIMYICEHAGMKVISVNINNTNGGSFQILATKTDSLYDVDGSVNAMIEEEEHNNYNEMVFLEDFEKRILKNKKDVMAFLSEAKANNKNVLGYGASTKGNVMLQYCGVTPDLIKAIADVNEDKYGCVTPGTCIPIISEEDARNMKPDYFVVLPWHFRDNILQKEKEYMRETGCKFVFCFPTMQIVGYEDL